MGIYTDLVTVEQAADRLNLHPKTVLRYIRDGRLAATRVGKSYRIVRAELDAFAGVVNHAPDTAAGARATCVVDVPTIAVAAAERTATFLQAAAMSRGGDGPPLHLETVFDPLAGNLKIIVIGDPSDVARLLEMLQLQLGGRS